MLTESNSVPQNLLRYQRAISTAHDLSDAASKTKEININELKRASRLIAQAHRDSSSPFNRLPTEYALQIASMICNPTVVNENEAVQIARKHFGRPS